MLNLIRETALLRDDLGRLPKPVDIDAVYNPLRYAWNIHKRYLERFTTGLGADRMQHRRIVLVGMNPGPHGMAQTGVPFGDVPHARMILGNAPKGTDQHDLTNAESWLHPARPIDGFSLDRREVSGTRMWGGLLEMWGSMDAILQDIFAVNYCPLLYFRGPKAENVTPPKLDTAYKIKMHALCDAYLLAVVAAFTPEVVLTMGEYADQRVQIALAQTPGRPKVLRIMHPSGANPRANDDGGRGWYNDAHAVLEAADLLPKK